MKAPSGEPWVHEVKHDGYRLMARKVDGRVRLYTKQGYDWSKKYPLIAGSLQAASDFSGARFRAQAQAAAHLTHSRFVARFRCTS